MTNFGTERSPSLFSKHRNAALPGSYWKPGLGLARLYDAVAASYSRDDAKFRDDLISRPLVVELVRSLGGGKSIIDVGCGDGHIGRLVGPFVERVTGLDISRAMLAQAAAKSANFENLEFIRGNMLNLGAMFPSRRFDVALGIFAFCCLRSCNQLSWALRSIYSILKDGGSAIIQVPDENEGNSKSTSEWIREHAGGIIMPGALMQRRLRTIDGEWVRVARYRYRPEDYYRSIKEAGFQIETVLEPKANSLLLRRFPDLKHESEVASSTVYILRK